MRGLHRPCAAVAKLCQQLYLLRNAFLYLSNIAIPLVVQMYVKCLPPSLCIPVQMSVSGSWKLQIQGLCVASMQAGRQAGSINASSVLKNINTHNLTHCCTDALLLAGNAHHQCCLRAMLTVQVEYQCLAGSTSMLNTTNEHCGRVSHSLIIFHGHYFF